MNNIIYIKEKHELKIEYIEKINKTIHLGLKLVENTTYYFYYNST